MYIIPVTVKESPIQGKGVFAVGNITKGTIAWKFVNTHDMTMSKEDASVASDEVKQMLEKVGYISKTTDR